MHCGFSDKPQCNPLFVTPFLSYVRYETAPPFRYETAAHQKAA